MNIAFLIKPKCETAFLYAQDSVRQGLEKMHYHRYTAIPVIREDGVYCGTITEGDFLWYILGRTESAHAEAPHCEIHTMERYTVQELLRPEFHPPVRIDATMEDLLTRVMEQNFVPVVDARDVFVGIVTRRDVIRYFASQASPKKDTDA